MHHRVKEERRRGPPQQPGHDHKMTAAADWDELGRALQDGQNNGLDDVAQRRILVSGGLGGSLVRMRLSTRLGGVGAVRGALLGC